MNNFEKIKQMSVDEMAEFLCKHHDCARLCAFYEDINSCLEVYKDCKEGIKQYLLQEVEDEL